jgi:hypothetical protein
MMKKRVCILLAALLALGTLTGCQKTPENPLVVGKDMAKMLRMAKAGNAAQ